MSMVVNICVLLCVTCVTCEQMTQEQNQVTKKAEIERMFGLDTGNPAADQEAEMWIAALLGN